MDRHDGRPRLGHNSVLSFTLDPGVAWEEQLQRSRVASTRISASLGDALADLLVGLGIPATPSVQVVTTGDKSASSEARSGELRILLDQHPLRYPADLPNRTPNVASDDDPLPILCRLVVDIVKMHPQRLLQDDAAAIYFANAAGGERIATRWAAPILRMVLARGVSLRDLTIVVRRLAEAAELGFAPDEVAEIVTARLRPRSIDIEIHPQYARALFGCDLHPGAPVPLSSLPAAVSVDGVSQTMFETLGLRTTGVRLTARADLSGTTFAVRINDLAGPAWQGLAPDECFIDTSLHLLSELHVRHTPRVNPNTRVTGAIVSSGIGSALQLRGTQVWNASSYLFLLLLEDLRRRAGQLLDIVQVEYELGLVGLTHRELVDAALARISSARLTAILRRLLESGVPIRDLRGILERVVSFRPILADCRERIVLGDGLILDQRYARRPLDSPTHYARYIRMGLARTIYDRVAGSTDTLPVFQLSPEAEEPILAHMENRAVDDDDPSIPLAQTDALHELIGQAVRAMPAAASRRAVLAKAEVAELLRETLPAEFPGLTVLSYDDLASAAEPLLMAGIPPS